MKPIEIELLVLGEIVKDKVSNLKGMIVACEIDMDMNVLYVFQPKLLDKDGNPAPKYLVSKKQITGEVKKVLIPHYILGTQVEDKATGYKGTAVAICLYMNGCIHIMVKDSGLSPNGRVKESHEFDIRRLTGEAIKQMSRKDLEESHKTTPSPESFPKRKISR